MPDQTGDPAPDGSLLGLDARASDDRVAALLASIAPDLYTAEAFVPWQSIDDALHAAEKSIDSLQHLVDAGRLDPEALEVWIGLPFSLAVTRALFAAPQAVGFKDGREIPERRPITARRRRELATLLVDLGIRRLLPEGVRVADLVRLGELSLDARRRGFRRKALVQNELNSLIQSAVEDAALETGVQLRRMRPTEWPAEARGRVTAVLAAGDQPIAAIVNVFQASSGGRQQRVLSETYPALQRDLDAVPMSLVLILDGQGIKATPRRILEYLIYQAGACMSTSQAAEGALKDALVDAIQNVGARRPRTRALDALIEGALEESLVVRASALPGSRERVMLAFGDYLASHPDRDLDLDLDTGELRWRPGDRVEKTHALRRSFDATAAVEAFGDLLGMEDLGWLPPDDPIVGAFGTLRDPILSERMLVAATQDRSSANNPEFLRTVGRLNRKRDTGGGIAVLLVPAGVTTTMASAQQRSMATSVVVITADQLDHVATSKSPRDAVIDLVLAQADLTKANPFTVMGATGRRMFYGRRAEEALLQHTLLTNSAALIGGRRIGKTSLLQHARERFVDAGWNVWYADCQAVGDWRSFTEHIRTHWSVDSSSTFSPGAVDEVFAELASRGAGPLVVMLDEVDNLLRWDRRSDGEGIMREPFFRTLRGISQEGTAQFVFSGERLIASVLWDPASPHWNFCRSIPVRQLAREDADELLAGPLASLGVELDDRPTCLDIAWTATSGHPQIVQQLGETLVLALNERGSEDRKIITPRDLAAVTESVSFRRHYVQTYWGQAIPLERLITALSPEGVHTVDTLLAEAHRLGVDASLKSIESAVRMLDLYGILDGTGETLRWRAVAFPQALAAFGGHAVVRDDVVRQLT